MSSKIVNSVSDIYVGNKMLVAKLLAASIANGHVLFEDYPGLGKTLLAKAFSRTIGQEYSRIQFTPDLLPSDITGSIVWRETGKFELKKGPIFANVILADEINRAPPKTQSALLESMEEKQVTIENNTHKLGPPFFVIATQNPIEQEGTYPLPEAQMDRFLLKLSTGYPSSLSKEVTIHKRRIKWKKDDPTEDIEPVISKEDFLWLQEMAENEVFVDDCILDYIGEIVRKTREQTPVDIGSSPRGGLALLKLARAFALMKGRDYVTPDDIKLFVNGALEHRMILDVEYSLEGIKEEDVIDKILDEVPVPKEYKK
ncbi:MAG: AAA family ATPase [Thermoplasmatota archaeon]